jgi:uncharacterized repeat protein (TIGR04138 family)
MTTYSEWACKLAVETQLSPEAIDFILLALDYVPNYRGEEPGVFVSPQHSHGRDLCRAFVGLAKETYGTDYISKLTEWNLTTSEKLGDAVYRLIQSGGMEADEQDQRSDFDNQFDILS